LDDWRFPVAREPTNKRYQGRVWREESKRIQRRHYSMHIAGIISLLSPSSKDEGRKRVASRRQGRLLASLIRRGDFSALGICIRGAICIHGGADISKTL
jgi:hypothetical protein